MTIKPLLRRSLTSIIFGAVCLLEQPSAEAVIVPVQNDALVSALATTNNYGHYADLVVIGTTNANRWSFLQFDVTPGIWLPSGTTGTHVSRAMLYLYANRVDAAGDMKAYKVTSTWNEGTKATGAPESNTITYANPPSIGTVQGTISIATADEAEYVEVDVTNLVIGVRSEAEYSFKLPDIHSGSVSRAIVVLSHHHLARAAARHSDADGITPYSAASAWQIDAITPRGKPISTAWRPNPKKPLVTISSLAWKMKKAFDMSPFTNSCTSFWMRVIHRG